MEKGRIYGLIEEVAGCLDGKRQAMMKWAGQRVETEVECSEMIGRVKVLEGEGARKW